MINFHFLNLFLVQALKYADFSVSKGKLLEGEDSIRFDRPFPIHTAIRSNSISDRITVEHEFIDGITWDTPHHYCLGRNYAKGIKKFEIITLRVDHFCPSYLLTPTLSEETRESILV